MGMWVLWKKKQGYVAIYCKNNTDMYQLTVAGNTDKYDQKKKKTVLHLSYPESHSLFQLLKNV